MNLVSNSPRTVAPTIRQIGMLFAVLLLSPARAQAQYVDPGSASLLWQLVVAGIVGLGFTTRHYLLALYHRLFSRGGKEPNDHTNAT